MTRRRIELPLLEENIPTLKAGEAVLLSGSLLSFRDAAHKRIIQALDAGEPLPINLAGETVYYMGPCPTPPGKVIGSAGPTTSGRMDSYTPKMLNIGVKGMIGKGQRNAAVIEAMVKHQAVYFTALGGAGVLIARSIKKAEVIAYPELGPEAIHRLVVEDLPVIVTIDAFGNDLYQIGRNQYSRV